MTSKGWIYGVIPLLVLLIGCGGGSGSGDTDPDPADPGPQGSELEVTVTGLVAELTVTWQGQTLILNPDRLSARAEDTGSNIVTEPSYESPQYQNCAEHEITRTGNKFLLNIVCAQPDRLQLLVTINGLDGELGIRWFDQDRSYDTDVDGSLMEIRPGALTEPSITAMPELQACTGEFAQTDNARVFSYAIACTERVVVNRILVDDPLPYPVTLALADHEPLIVQNQNAQFSGGSSPLNEVSITDTGGTQQCELEKLPAGDARDEQSWSLSCREYLVYSDIRTGQSGAYLIYGDGERFLLESGDVGSQAVQTFTTLGKQVVLHPDFGAKTLNLATSGVTWQPLNQIPDGRILQSLITRNFAYFTVISQGAGGSDFHVWSIGEDLDGKEIWTGPAPESEVELLPVSPGSDTIGLDYRLLGSRNVSVTTAGEAPVLAWPVSREQGVVHMIQTRDFQSQPLYWFFYPNEDGDRADAYFSAVLTSVADFDPDAQSNILTWYDSGGDERVLLLGEGVGGLNQPRRLVELDLLVDLAWEVPLDLPFADLLGYMGTDDAGQTLVISSGDGQLEDGLAAMVTSQGVVDLAALRQETGISGQLRIRPLERDNAGGTYRQAQVYNGWLLMFEGGATGKVWLTNGRASHTWLVASEANWAEFRAGAYNVVAAGASMAAISYENNGVKQMTFPGVGE